MAKNPNWTEADNAFLRKHHGKLSTEELVNRFQRSSKAIGVRASRLGVRSRKNGFTAKDLARELGVSVSTVTRWIHLGLLGAKRRNTYEPTQRPSWFEVSEEAIISFIQIHYLKYDPNRFAKCWKKHVPWEKRALWMSIAEASAQYYYSYQWFYELIWVGLIRADKGCKGWGRSGSTTYVFKDDIERVITQSQNDKELKLFSLQSEHNPRGGYKKGAHRGPLRGWVRVKGSNPRQVTMAFQRFRIHYEMVLVEVTGESFLVKMSQEKQDSLNLTFLSRKFGLTVQKVTKSQKLH